MVSSVMEIVFTDSGNTVRADVLLEDGDVVYLQTMQATYFALLEDIDTRGLVSRVDRTRCDVVGLV